LCLKTSEGESVEHIWSVPVELVVVALLATAVLVRIAVAIYEDS